MSIIERIRTWFLNLFTYEVNESEANNENKNGKNGPNVKSKAAKGTTTKKATRKLRLPKITLHKLWKFIKILAKVIFKSVMIGIILNVIAAYFYPELPERIPAIFGWYDGWIQFGEFLAKYAFGLLSAMMHGMNETWRYLTEFPSHFHEMWIQFINWLSTIHF